MDRANPVQLEAVKHTEVPLQLRQFHPRSLAQCMFRVSRMKFSGRYFPKDVVPQAIRWYASYPLSLRMRHWQALHFAIFCERGSIHVQTQYQRGSTVTPCQNNCVWQTLIFCLF